MDYVNGNNEGGGQQQHPLRRKMVLRVCREVLNIRAQSYQDIPGNVRKFLAFLPYRELIRPLMEIDRRRGLSYGQLCITFDVPKGYVEYHFNSKQKFEE